MQSSTHLNIQRGYDDVAAIYDTVYGDSESQRENQELRRMLLGLIIPERSSVLDLGCGTGLAADLCSWKSLKGIDLSPKMLQIARKKHPDYIWVQGDMNNLADRGPYDVVLSLFGSMAYVTANRDCLFRRAIQALCPGGLFFIMAKGALDCPYLEREYIPQKLKPYTTDGASIWHESPESLMLRMTALHSKWVIPFLKTDYLIGYGFR